VKNKFLLLIVGLMSLNFQTATACTIFSCARAGEIFAASNEDDNTPFTRIWYNPGTKERYGSVCFGGPDMQVAAAMNEYGLFFDFAAASYDISKLKLNNPFNGFLMWEVLGKCKNVKEALEIIKKYDYNSASQVLLADKEGNSILINPTGIIEKKGNFQVNANCNMINKKLSCRRPEIVNGELSKSKKNKVEFLKEILNKTHQEGENLTTLYSTIFDLKRGIVYVYLFHNYETAYKIDLKAELKKGYRIENLADHFPASFAYESFSKNHSLYLKESIVNEINKTGVDHTIDKYIAESQTSHTKDSMLSPALLEVALQLIKYSWNEHTNGGMWDYWFSLPKGYEIKQFQDSKMDAAEKLLQYLSGKENPDKKLTNFMFEIQAYIHLVKGDFGKAKSYYEKAIAIPSDTYSVTLTRATEMIKRLNK
jgi:hypothetical protein